MTGFLEVLACCCCCCCCCSCCGCFLPFVAAAASDIDGGDSCSLMYQISSPFLHLLPRTSKLPSEAGFPLERLSFQVLIDGYAKGAGRLLVACPPRCWPVSETYIGARRAFPCMFGLPGRPPERRPHLEVAE